MQTFKSKFIQLLSNKIYALPTTFVELYLRMTNLHIFYPKNRFAVLHTRCPKSATIFFLLCLWNMNRFQYKLLGMSWKKHLTELCKKCPTHLKYMPTLPWETQYLHMYILMHHWIATNTTGSYCLKNRQMCSRPHHIYIVFSKCLHPVRKQAWRHWRYVANHTFNEQRDSDCSRVHDASSQFIEIWDLGMRWRRTFRTCSLKMM